MARVKKTMRKRSNTKRSKIIRRKTMRSQTAGGETSLKKEINDRIENYEKDQVKYSDDGLGPLVDANYEYFNKGEDYEMKKYIDKFKSVMFKNNNIFNKKTDRLDVEKKLNKLRTFLVDSVITNLNLIFQIIDIPCATQYNYQNIDMKQIDKENIKCMLNFFHDTLRSTEFDVDKKNEILNRDVMIKETLYYLISIVALKELYAYNKYTKDILKYRGWIWTDEKLENASSSFTAAHKATLKRRRGNTNKPKFEASFEKDEVVGGHRKKRKTRRHR